MNDVEMLKSNGINVEKSLEVLGDMDMYNETMDDFLGDINNKVNLLNTYKGNGDMANYAIYAHSLKSDARYLGFEKLAELSLNHEMAGKGNDSAYVSAHFEELIREADRIVTICKNYRGTNTQTSAVSQTTSDKKTILISDDSSIIQNIIGKMIGEEYNVVYANDGGEAIKIIDSNQSLIGMFLDLNMPNIDGFEVLKHLNNNNMFLKVPVAIITGDDSKETIMKAFDYPILDVLAKPFNETDVQRIISSMNNK